MAHAVDRASALSFAGWVAAALTGCATGPVYEEFEVAQHEEPQTTFRFSAGNATPVWPIMMTIPGREIRDDENSERMSLQRYWVSGHVRDDARLVSMGLGECGRPLGGIGGRHSRSNPRSVSATS